jgi:hypothetical protein
MVSDLDPGGRESLGSFGCGGAGFSSCVPWRHRLQELEGPWLLGAREDAFGLALLDDAAPVEEADAIGDLAGEPHLVGDEQHREIAGSGVERQADDPGRDRIKGNADEGQGVVEPEELHDERGATEDLDIDERDRAEDPSSRHEGDAGG